MAKNAVNPYGEAGTAADIGAGSPRPKAYPSRPHGDGANVRNRGKSPNSGPPADVVNPATYRGGDARRGEYLEGTPLSKASTAKMSKAASADDPDAVFRSN